jgi:hypothetical protein
MQGDLADLVRRSSAVGLVDLGDFEPARSYLRAA